jgi:hypothetical protein
METGAEKKFNTFRHGRGPLFDITELELGGASKIGINTGIRVNRHGPIITIPFSNVE